MTTGRQIRIIYNQTRVCKCCVQIIKNRHRRQQRVCSAINRKLRTAGYQKITAARHSLTCGNYLIIRIIIKFIQSPIRSRRIPRIRRIIILIRFTTDLKIINGARIHNQLLARSINNGINLLPIQCVIRMLNNIGKRLTSRSIHIRTAQIQVVRLIISLPVRTPIKRVLTVPRQQIVDPLCRLRSDIPTLSIRTHTVIPICCSRTTIRPGTCTQTSISAGIRYNLRRP